MDFTSVTRTRHSSGLAPRLALAAVAILASLSVGAPAGGLAISSSSGSKTTSTPSLFLPLVHRDAIQVADFPFGVQLGWFSTPDWPDQALLALREAAIAGASWVRIPLAWDWIEPQDTLPENYLWPADFEAVLADAAKRDMHVILSLQSNPLWACPPGSCSYTWFPGGPIDNMNDLAEFLQAAVERYGVAPYYVKHWEFYNEADALSPSLCVQRGYGCFGAWPTRYAEELAVAYTAIKAVDSEAQVLFSGLAYDRWGDYFSETFLDDVLAWFRDQNGADFAFDLMNFHYYPYFRAKWEEFGLGPDIIGKATYIASKLSNFGADKPIVCTEAGMWSDSPNSPPWKGSEEEQSRYVVQVFARSQAAGLDSAIWFWLVDSEGEPVAYGLLNSDLSRKPSFTAYQTLTAQLRAYDYVRTLGPAETGSAEIEAYEFRAHSAQAQIYVVWTNDELSHSLALASSRVSVVDKYGAASTVRDGDDGSVDGQVHLTVGASPLYLRPQ